MAIQVLVVDDDFFVREMTKGVSEQIGCVVIGEAASGLEAIELSQSLKPDLILMDIDMPGLNGFEAARYCTVPVVFLTGNDVKDVAEQARRAGASACLTKPVTAFMLERAVAVATAH